MPAHTKAVVRGRHCVAMDIAKRKVCDIINIHFILNWYDFVLEKNEKDMKCNIV